MRESNRLIINTSAIETLADWQAHTVSIDYFFLGYLKDKTGSAKELHPFEVPAFLIDGAPGFSTSRSSDEAPASRTTSS